MIVCRRCMARHDDQSARCSSCDADLTGPDGIRIATDPIPEAHDDLPLLDSLDDSIVSASPTSPSPSIDPTPSASPPAVASSGSTAPRATDPGRAETEGRASLADTTSEPPSPPERDRGQRQGVVPIADSDVDSDTGPPFIVFRPRVTDPGQPAITGDYPSGPEPAEGRRAVRPDEVEDERGPDAANVGSEAEEQPRLAPIHDDQPKRSPKAGEVACRRCFEPNLRSRRFCLECGGPMPAFDGDDTMLIDLTPPPDNWWRKLTRTTAHGGVDRRTWRQRERDSGQARRAYGSSRTLETRLALAGAGALALVAAVVVFANRDRLFGSQAEATSAAEIVLTSQEAVPPHGPERAIDGIRETGLGLTFTPAGESVDGIQQIVPVSFTVQLGGPTTIEALEIDVGFANDALDQDPALFARAHQLTILGLSSEPLPFTLDNEAGPQRRSFDLGDVVHNQFIVRVESVHDPGWETYPVAVFVEIGVVGDGGAG